MEVPVAKNWNILVGMSEKIFSDDHDSASSWSKVLLSSHVDHGKLIPWDVFGTDVGGHITDYWHILWNQVPWEIVIVLLKSIHGLVAAEGEVRTLGVHFPLRWVHHSCAVIVSNVVGDNIYVSEFFSLIPTLQ